MNKTRKFMTWKLSLCSSVAFHTHCMMVVVMKDFIVVLSTRGNFVLKCIEISVINATNTTFFLLIMEMKMCTDSHLNYWWSTCKYDNEITKIQCVWFNILNNILLTSVKRNKDITRNYLTHNLTSDKNLLACQIREVYL